MFLLVSAVPALGIALFKADSIAALVPGLNLGRDEAPFPWRIWLLVTAAIAIPGILGEVWIVLARFVANGEDFAWGRFKNGDVLNVYLNVAKTVAVAFWRACKAAVSSFFKDSSTIVYLQTLGPDS